jgi:hypothetical protein
MITFELPVVIFVSAFGATVFEGRLDLSWDIMCDQELVDFKICRGIEGQTAK